MSCVCHYSYSRILRDPLLFYFCFLVGQTEEDEVTSHRTVSQMLTVLHQHVMQSCLNAAVKQ